MNFPFLTDSLKPPPPERPKKFLLMLPYCLLITLHKEVLSKLEMKCKTGVNFSFNSGW